MTFDKLTLSKYSPSLCEHHRLSTLLSYLMQLFLRAIVTSILHFLLQLGALLIEELVIQTSVATAYQVTPPKTNPT